MPEFWLSSQSSRELTLATWQILQDQLNPFRISDNQHKAQGLALPDLFHLVPQATGDLAHYQGDLARHQKGRFNPSEGTGEIS